MNRVITLMRKVRNFILNGYQENLPLSLPSGSSVNLCQELSGLETFPTMVLGTGDPELISVITDSKFSAIPESWSL